MVGELRVVVHINQVCAVRVAPDSGTVATHIFCVHLQHKQGWILFHHFHFYEPCTFYIKFHFGSLSFLFLILNILIDKHENIIQSSPDLIYG